jgi:hypothetical protein
MVVAPGLIVYERLLDAFCGKLVGHGNGARDFAQSHVAQFADLFIPESHRDAAFAFERGNVCSKNEIGLKATGNGMIAITKGSRFVQVDFSATPYNDVGSGKNKRKEYFPHSITDFDLKSAMRAGLVKSLVLDRRKEIGVLPLEFKAERDESGNAL